jgi:dTDP-4-amino-4,6-dideoxygalactose transaminase
VRRHLRDSGIATVLNYPKALPFYAAYAYLCHGPEDFPNAYANQYRILSLPIYPEIPDEAIKEVASEIKNALKLTTGRPRSQAAAEPILNRI